MSDHHKIDVQVETHYIANNSNPAERSFVFAYVITITNLGAIGAQLMTRHWIITDGNGDVEHVRGDGVVGEQPHLMPGQSFEYTSGAVLETPVGTMEGSYQMVADDGESFDAEIPKFVLSAHSTLH